MLTLTIKDKEFFDQEEEVFLSVKGRTLELEHSLISLSRWESKWEIPFIDEGEKTNEQLIDYIKYMTVTRNVDPLLYRALTAEDYAKVNNYIGSKASATIIKSPATGASKLKKTEFVTSELIYYWMVAYNIPFDCEKWHLNRLLNLIQICNIKNQPEKKRSRSDMRSLGAERRKLNAERRRQMGSTG